MHELNLIGDDAALRDLAARLSQAPAIAMDTEFVRESTYYPKLCLLQVASADTIAGVDCLAGLDMAPLYEVLFEPGRRLVLHSARQDLEVIWNATGRLPDTIVDTQLAAALVGFAPQISLSDLLARTLGIELDKAHTRTDWTKRPIAAAPFAYALDDVRHLLLVWAHLEARLGELGRLAWFEEDARRLLATPLVTDAATQWSRLRGIARLPEAAQRAALALLEWREAQAQHLDRPRRWILSDDLVTEIARRRPATQAELGAVPELPKRLAARAGTGILAALRAAERDADYAPPAGANAEPPDKARVKSLQAAVGARARELELHAEVLATRRDLTAVAAGNPPEHLAAGWRASELASVLNATATGG